MTLAEEYINQCKCELCQLEINCQERELHQIINLLLSRMDEQMRRWFAAYLAQLYGNTAYAALITGISDKTIRRGTMELDTQLNGFNAERTRLPGAGRPRKFHD